jgi:mono/diheme cytochrome c family protein
MTKNTLIILGTALVCLGVSADINLAQQKKAQVPTPPAQRTQTPAAATRKAPVARSAAATAGAPAAGLMTVEAQAALTKQYCAGCHNDVAKRGDMSLAALDLAHPEKNAVLTEKIIRKVRAGMMPPPNYPRPDEKQLKLLASTLESAMDRGASLRPNPGYRPFQRLTRTEYAKSIKDLLGIEIDVEALLPADNLSGEGFDNNAAVQGLSATLTEAYLRAANKISRQALGDPRAPTESETFKIPRTASQMRHVEGAPFGTRGGIAKMYNFPADGEYNFRSLMHGEPTGRIFGMTKVSGEQLEISIDGERIKLIDIDPRLSESTPTGLNLETGNIFVKAGPHMVAAAFLVKHSELIDDTIAPIEHTLADTQIGVDREITTYPHLREFEISGPFNVTGVSDTPSRRRVFICRPLSTNEEIPCASKIMTALAKEAFRRPVTAEDMEGLMSFYEQGRKNADFESGIRLAVQALITSPDFVFRLEQVPATVKPGQIYRISDIELASRLSYFLWNTPPDDELMTVATQGKLKDPIVLEKQVRRMLASPRSESLSTKFGALWLQLGRLQVLHPDAFYYPQYDHVLGEALKRETELFFDSLIREDRNALDLLNADYTFVNERLAKFYGIPNILGSEFRKVQVTEDYRKGILGKGAVLAMTSYADRTSPVQRGKWVMEVLLGTPPPPPPPVVPKLDETPAVAGGRALTVRERMETHRNNDACRSCHTMIDPIGLALENFDLTGSWRERDTTPVVNSGGVRVHTLGVSIDPVSKLYDGTPLNGPASLRQAMVNHGDMVIQTLTERLMAYALGRKLETFDMPTVRSITRDAAKNNNKMSSLILGIVKSPAFLMNKAEAPATDAAKQQ